MTSIYNFDCAQSRVFAFSKHSRSCVIFIKFISQYFASINRAQGQAAAILAIAEASAEAIRKTAAAIQSPGGSDAVNLKVAEQYVAAFANMAKTNNSIIIPANLSDMSGMIASAMQVIKSQGGSTTHLIEKK